MTSFGSINPALFCDLYELTMAAAYVEAGLDETVTFELFVRSLPPTRNFLVAAGLHDVLDAMDAWEFDSEAMDYLRTRPELSDTFLDRVDGLRFSGDVRAIAEGEVVFAQEPLIEITAPLVEAQLLETLLLNLLGTATMQASKAARVTLAADGRSYADFSARRDHGTAAAMSAARAAVTAGASSTSLVEAGRRHGLALSGTMAHAYVMAFDDERDAFRLFARAFPETAVMLIDTWDTVDGARHVVEVARELRDEGIRISAVRLDSGDLDELSREVRVILDQGGLDDVRILASGDLDEHRVDALVRGGAPIDAFGVGTRMGTSDDAPSLGVVYKLVDGPSGPRLKLSEGKATLPGRKQVDRRVGFDVLGLHDDECRGRALLQAVVANGERLCPAEDVATARERCRDAVAALPAHLRSLAPADPPYEVRISPRLHDLQSALTERHRA